MTSEHHNGVLAPHLQQAPCWLLGWGLDIPDSLETTESSVSQTTECIQRKERTVRRKFLVSGNLEKSKADQRFFVRMKRMWVLGFEYDLSIHSNEVFMVVWIISSGQIIIFHQPRFPWNSRGFPLQKATFWGKSVVWGRYNLTNEIPDSPDGAQNCSLRGFHQTHSYIILK